ncbi:MAG: 5'-methylthioadenosine/adenosylhomocysteine nucleosidase [bacterium]
MAIGIMGAMPEEIFLISENITGKKITTIGGRDYITGKLCEQNVVAVFSRWGKVAAAQSATTLITNFNVKTVIFTGVAGGADPDLNIGDIVIARDLLQHDMDASPIPAFKKFEIPLLGLTHFISQLELRTHAEKAAARFLASSGLADIDSEILAEYGILTPKIAVGTIATGDEFIADKQKIAKLREEINGLLCIEMEGAAVAQVCHEHLVPFVVIRAISDKADSDAMHDFSKFVKNVVNHYSLGIVTEMLTQWEHYN